VQQSTEVEHHEENQEEFEDEAIDEELQKQMKNVNIDENAFGGKTQKDSTGKTNKKPSAQGKKKKGEDFLEYASKNGIQVNLEYESNTNTYKKGPYVKKPYEGQKTGTTNTYYKKEGQTGSETTAKDTTGGNSEGYKKGKFSKKPYNGGKTNYTSNGGNGNFRNPHFKVGNNKFDLCNNNMPMYNPYMFNQNKPQVYQEQVDVNEHLLKEGTNEGVLQYLENFLSLENMNKDLYLRNRLDSEGYISIRDLANFNKLKRNGITGEKIEELVKSNENPVIECASLNSGKNNELYVRNREWDGLKEQLLSKEQIYQQNKQAKKYNNTLNYVSLQNNYFINTVPHGSYPSTPEMMMNPGQMGQMQMGYPGMYVMPMQQGYHPMSMPMNYQNYHSVPQQTTNYVPQQQGQGQGQQVQQNEEEN
jgi:hypothetical protein